MGINIEELRTLAENARAIASPIWIQREYEDGDAEVGGYGVMLPDTMILGKTAKDEDGPYDEFDAGNVKLAAYFVALHPTRLLSLLDEVSRARDTIAEQDNTIRNLHAELGEMCDRAAHASRS